LQDNKYYKLIKYMKNVFDSESLRKTSEYTAKKGDKKLYST